MRIAIAGLQVEGGILIMITSKITDCKCMLLLARYKKSMIYFDHIPNTFLNVCILHHTGEYFELFQSSRLMHLG